MELNIKLTLLGLLAILPWQSFAAEELLVRNSVKVYAAPRASSEVITTLEQGERVPISPKEYGRFRKVLVQSGGKRRAGYILKTSLQGNRIREVRGRSSKASTEKVYHTRTGFGLPLNLSYTGQSAWTFSSSDGSKIDIASFAGVSVFFGLSLDLPLDPQWSLRGEVLFRKVSQTGTATPSGGSPTPIERSISLLGFGATAKYYSDANSNFWLGGGVEIAKATGIQLTFANTSAPVAESDFPTYFILKPGLGQDFHLTSDLFLLAEARALLVLNTSPVIYGAEIGLTVAYAF